MVTEDVLSGRYRWRASLGQGAMGEVWLADDLLLGRAVAIKAIRPDPHAGIDRAAVERMAREARVAARLQHPNVVAVFDLLHSDGQPHVVMEYVRGESLAERIRRSGRLSPAEAGQLIAQVAAALEAAHGAGIVHRDVKPANILIADDGTAKLADFGIARAAGDATLTQTGMVIGTPAYLAPEVARGGESSPSSDVWALGATLYLAMEGSAPFGQAGDNTLAVLARVLSESPAPPRSAGELAPLIVAMLDREPAHRPTAGQVRLALAGQPAEVTRPVDSPTRVRPTGPTTDSTIRRTAVAVLAAEPVSRTAPKRRRAPVVAVVGVLALIVAGAALALSQAHHHAAPTAATTPVSARPLPTSTISTTRAAVAPLTRPRTASSPAEVGAAQLQAFVINYYALIPAHLPSAWARLGPGLRIQGYASYVGWWSRFDGVRVTPLSVDVAQRTVTIRLTTHSPSSGQSSTDTEVLALIPSTTGTGLMIDADRVL